MLWSKTNGIFFLLTDGHFEVEPEHRPGTAKYCGHRPGNIGLYTTESFGALAVINPQLTEILKNDANNSLSTSTWKVYTTVQRHLT